MQAAKGLIPIPGVSAPFPGLRPFESEEEPIFCGRQQHTDELLRRLSARRFLAVVGTSGSGKSSLVRAGLRPALDRGYLAGATSHWRIAIMRPGMAPIKNLAEALRQPEALGKAEDAELSVSSLGLVEAVLAAHLAPGESLLVAADQFEELFRFQRHASASDGGAEAALFVNLLLTAAARPDVSVYVVLTMRSDFLGDCAQFPGLPEALSESQYLIPRLSREQRREAIEQPLRLFGATMTPQLVERLLNDSGAESPAMQANEQYRGGAPDPLPVLQHALMRSYLAWDHADRRIDLDDYRKAGSMESALNEHAEEVFRTDLDEAGRKWAERIFRCLTTTELGRPVRRPTPLADLYKVIGAGPEDRSAVDAVLSVLQSPRNSFVKIQKDTTVDITHESLIWKWRLLAEWVKEEAAGADLYRDLVKDANGKATWGEPKLSSTVAVRDGDDWNEDWARQYSEGRFQDVEAFLLRSRKAVRKQMLLRWFGLVAAVLLVILAVVAYYSSRQAFQKARELDALKIVESGLNNEQAALKDKLNGLNVSQGTTKEERDRIAKEKAALQAQLDQSVKDSQKLAAQAQQSTDLTATVKSLQSRLEQVQKERDDAVQARAAEHKIRQDSESRATQLETRINTMTKDLESAKAGKSEVLNSPSVQQVLPAEPQKARNAGSSVEVRKNSKDGLNYVFIPAGTFRMGCSDGDLKCGAEEKPAHEVHISKGFWLGQTAVTMEAWKRYTKSGKTIEAGTEDNLPAMYMTWQEAARFCQWAGGRLPTEAEWEYAARAGTTTSRYGPLDSIAWTSLHAVAGKEPNAWKLYDMLGNVLQWTADRYGSYADKEETDPKGPATGNLRTLRGGSWGADAGNPRVSNRLSYAPGSRLDYLGVRCVLDAEFLMTPP